jgi:multiple sugar transport system permease protein
MRSARARKHGDRRPVEFPGAAFVNSLIIAFGSTLLCGRAGHAAAYAFSRFKVPLKDDLLFFILSTRMMPPIAVAIPIFLMYRELGLSDTHARHDPALYLGQRLAGGLAAQGLHRRDPARIRRGGDDRRLHAAAGLPQGRAAAGHDRHRATAIFCLIFAWNEYAFAVLLTSGTAQTAPPFIPIIIGEGGQDWPAVAAGTTLFLIPILVFTVLLRKHLLRGITFGAVRK